MFPKCYNVLIVAIGRRTVTREESRVKGKRIIELIALFVCVHTVFTAVFVRTSFPDMSFLVMMCVSGIMTSARPIIMGRHTDFKTP